MKIEIRSFPKEENWDKLSSIFALFGVNILSDAFCKSNLHLEENSKEFFERKKFKDFPSVIFLWEKITTK
jgi:hypothetical protein